VSSPPVVNPIPVYNTQVVAQGLARLTSSFITQPNVRKMLAVYLQPLQDLEDAFFAIFTSRLLATAQTNTLPATNVTFDVLGQIVGIASRGAFSDADMQTVIALQVAINRSTGRTTNWSQFAQILAPLSSGTPTYLEGAASIVFGLWGLLISPLTIGSMLSRALPNGVAGLFQYSTWLDGNDFEWSSRSFASAGQGTWGSRYSANVGGLLVAAQRL
jgi:hypothetical protein